MDTFLRSEYLKTRTQTNFQLYKKEKIFCSKLHKRERRKSYEPLDMKYVQTEKNFGKE